ncbi:MAG TPA: hypothetical protein VE964_15765 [Myxococcales bacterium]|nr:hypothetical protein [Myxococcales bacterium]
MLRSGPVAILPLLLAAAPPASQNRAPPSRDPSVLALGDPELIAALGPLRTSVGSWVEYLVRAPGEEDVHVRLSVVPPALGSGRAWLEVAVLGEQALPFAARLLVDRAGGIERAIVYALGQAPLEIPLGDLQVPEKGAPRSAGRAVPVGAAEVTVPAGNFHAEELRIASRSGATRVWRSARVPLWGLVRAEGAGRVVELTALGEKGARSVFPDDHGKGSESAQ